MSLHLSFSVTPHWKVKCSHWLWRRPRRHYTGTRITVCRGSNRFWHLVCLKQAPHTKSIDLFVIAMLPKRTVIRISHTLYSDADLPLKASPRTFHNKNEKTINPTHSVHMGLCQNVFEWTRSRYGYERTDKYLVAEKRVNAVHVLYSQ